jgi:hypothetical protein
MGLSRRLRRRSDATALAWAERGVFCTRFRAPTEQHAFAGLAAAARVLVEEGCALHDIVGLIAPDLALRLVFRSALPRMLPTLTLPESDPPGMLLVVTERDGEPRFQHLQVT